MKSKRFSFLNIPFSPVSTVLALLAFSICSSPAGEPGRVFFENPAPAGAFSEEKPAFLYFKDITVIRKEKLELRFDVTLRGKIPANLDTKVVYYFGFDIDADPATGSSALGSSNFGQDIGVWFVKEQKSSRFEEMVGSLLYHGKNQTLKVTQAKVKGDKIEFDVRSELFGFFPTLKVFGDSEQTFFKRGLKTNSVQVNQIPTKGTLAVPSE
jgi:hypothetical protein